MTSAELRAVAATRCGLMNLCAHIPTCDAFQNETPESIKKKDVTIITKIFVFYLDNPLSLRVLSRGSDLRKNV